ncbi:MAG: hypothetical protein EA355_15920 [Rhodobacteraceae bacterium]|nr:MAG: hypothetical protein EA355_15920 [Paracoccaceae bacterium]
MTQATWSRRSHAETDAAAPEPARRGAGHADDHPETQPFIGRGAVAEAVEVAGSRPAHPPRPERPSARGRADRPHRQADDLRSPNEV